MRELPVLSGAPSLAYDVTEPAELDRSCTRCALGKSGKARTVCMPAEVTGPEAGPVLLALGIAPGVDEDRSGRPFAGGNGAYFRNLISKKWPGPVILDNAVRCAPGATELKPAYVDACRPYGVGIRYRAPVGRI